MRVSAIELDSVWLGQSLVVTVILESDIIKAEIGCLGAAILGKATPMLHVCHIGSGMLTFKIHIVLIAIWHGHIVL